MAVGPLHLPDRGTDANGCCYLAFGIFARALPDTDEFLTLRAQTAGLELADSITVDGHKILNVVCDSSRQDGILLSDLHLAIRYRHLPLPPPDNTRPGFRQPQRRLSRYRQGRHHPEPSEHRTGELPPLPRPAGLCRPAERRPFRYRADGRQDGEAGPPHCRLCERLARL